MKSLLAMLKGCIASLILTINIVVIFSTMMPFALAKLLLPVAAVRRVMDRILNSLAQTWIAVNGWWMALMQRIDWQVTGLDGLRQRAWYLVSSNHQTWVDILVLQKVFVGKIPFLKFFLKL